MGVPAVWQGVRTQGKAAKYKPRGIEAGGFVLFETYYFPNANFTVRNGIPAITKNR